MKSFLDSQAVKDRYLARVEAHRKADEVVKGVYWEDGKGCAVGCTVHSDSHAAYETELGIPEWLAHVEDRIFEGLPNARAKTWPSEFLSAIPVGVDLDQVKTPFLVYVLEDAIRSARSAKFDETLFPDVKDAVDRSIEVVEETIRCLKEGSDLSTVKWTARAVVESAESTANSMARPAESAARSAGAAARSAAYVKFADKLLELLERAI